MANIQNITHQFTKIVPLNYADDETAFGQ